MTCLSPQPPQQALAEPDPQAGFYPAVTPSPRKAAEKIGASGQPGQEATWGCAWPYIPEKKVGIRGRRVGDGDKDSFPVLHGEGSWLSSKNTLIVPTTAPSSSDPLTTPASSWTAGIEGEGRGVGEVTPCPVGPRFSSTSNKVISGTSATMSL